jgi:hypothetical protein
MFLISFGGNGNWGAFRNCVIQSDFSSSQKTRIEFPNDQTHFIKKIGHYFWTPPRKRIFKSDGRYLIFCEYFPTDFLLYLFSKNRPFFHSTSKRWKLRGKIYWKLHFLVFPYFLFFKYFPKILKRREILVLFSEEFSAWMEFLIMSFGRLLTF